MIKIEAATEEEVVEATMEEAVGIEVTATQADTAQVEVLQMEAAGVMDGAEEPLVPIFRAARAVEDILQAVVLVDLMGGVEALSRHHLAVAVAEAAAVMEVIVSLNIIGTSIFIGNLPYSATEEKLSDWLSHQGVSIKRINILKDGEGKSKGIGFADLADSRDLDKALRFNKSMFEGRSIAIEKSNRK